MTTIEIKDQSGNVLAAHAMPNNVFLLTLAKALADGAVLHGADLSGQSLKGLDFRKADLRQANFRNADLRGAVLTDANFDGADFTDAQFSPAVDFSRTSLVGAQFSDPSIKEAAVNPVAASVA